MLWREEATWEALQRRQIEMKAEEGASRGRGLSHSLPSPLFFLVLGVIIKLIWDHHTFCKPSLPVQPTSPGVLWALVLFLSNSFFFLPHPN